MSNLDESLCIYVPIYIKVHVVILNIILYESASVSFLWLVRPVITLYILYIYTLYVSYGKNIYVTTLTTKPHFGTDLYLYNGCTYRYTIGINILCTGFIHAGDFLVF